MTNAMTTTPFEPHRANALPNGATIIQRVYRPVWGRWLMLCCHNDKAVQPYVVWDVQPDGEANNGDYFGDYAPALDRYLKRINTTV